MNTHAVVAALLLLSAGPVFSATACPIRNAHDDPLPGWPEESVFKLSVNYPQVLPPDPDQPWKKFDFRTDWKGYINAVLAYVREGHESPEVDWYSDRNTKRAWYHALWMDRSESGREFVHGLTRERPPNAGDLLPGSKRGAQSWAVGAYNDVGGFSLGKVSKNPCNPNLDKVLFDEGTVSFKLLFTSATPKELPFLENTKKWKADIWTTVDQPRDANGRSLPAKRGKPQDVYLMQLDVAVRDNAASETGWVFGTFVYRSDAPGVSVFDRMVPVSLQWGNDPDVPAGGELAQSRVNADLAGKNFGWKERPWFGWHGRANGPIDNKESSCLSCHGAAQFPRSVSWGNLIATNPKPPQQSIRDEAHRRSVYFRNLKPGELFDPTTPGARPLDYSLQLQAGLERMCGAFGTGFGAGIEADLVGIAVPEACIRREAVASGLRTAEVQRYLKIIIKGAEMEESTKKGRLRSPALQSGERRQ